MEKKIRKQVGTLPSTDMAASGLREITYIDGNGKTLKTVHDGSFNPYPEPAVTPDYLYFEAKQANSTLSFYSLMSDAPSFEYSEDGTTWEEWTYTDTTDQGVTAHIFNTITLENIGDKVYLRGTNTALSDENNTMAFFSMTGSFDGGGNVTSLLDGDGSSTSIPDYGLYELFYDRVHSGNTALVTPPSFGDVTTIGLGGCNSMYYACASMTSAPDMSKIVSIGDYGCGNMFVSTSISKAADMDALSTIGEEGLRSMYYDTEIVTPANMGNVTSFGDNACGEMYEDGSILIDNGVLTFDFPALPITDGGGNTYSTPQEVADWMTYAG